MLCDHPAPAHASHLDYHGLRGETLENKMLYLIDRFQRHRLIAIALKYEGWTLHDQRIPLLRHLANLQPDVQRQQCAKVAVEPRT
ncbi:MAG: hypothetical protein H8D43_02345 [Chloroflexi bacterium]|nr:hypothetical protein [Chloroflexota bacterium]